MLHTMMTCESRDNTNYSHIRTLDLPKLTTEYVSPLIARKPDIKLGTDTHRTDTFPFWVCLVTFDTETVEKLLLASIGTIVNPAPSAEDWL